MEEEMGRAAIWEVDRKTGAHRLFATGLRNPNGLVWSQSNSLPAAFHNGMFVGQHGSWNRNPPSGYNVVFVSFSNGKPSGQPIEGLRGFLSPEGDAYGRPVGVAIDNRGGLLVADDVGNIVWRVTAAR
jgi:glucose/arabinose dehydrogenase